MSSATLVSPMCLSKYFNSLTCVDPIRKAYLDEPDKSVARMQLIEQMNEFFFLLCDGSKKLSVYCKVYVEAEGRAELVGNNDAALKKFFTVMEQRMDPKTRTMKSYPVNLMTIWINSCEARKIDVVEFNPALTPGIHIQNRRLPTGEYLELRVANTYPGMPYGEDTFLSLSEEEQQESRDAWEWIREEYIRKIICNKNLDLLAWLLMWICWLYQVPERKSELMPVLIGPQGNGKTKFCEKLCEFFGPLGYLLAKSSRINDKFNNSSLDDRILVVLDEGRFDTQAEMDQLKSWITNKTYTKEKKGLDTFSVKGYHNFMLTSNDECCLKFGTLGAERRLVFFEVANKGWSIEDKIAFFRKVDDGFAKAYPYMGYFFFHMEMDEARLRRIPYSTLLTTQKLASMTPFDAFFANCVDYGYTLPIALGPDGRTPTSVYENGELFKNDPLKPTWLTVVPGKPLYERFKTNVLEWSKFARTMREFIEKFELLFKRGPKGSEYKPHENKNEYLNFPTHEHCKEIVTSMTGYVVEKQSKNKRPLDNDPKGKGKSKKQHVIDPNQSTINF